MATDKKKSQEPKMSPACEAVRFKPGQSGNPAGRPVRKPMTDTMNLLLDAPMPKDKLNRTRRLALLEKLIDGAINGRDQKHLLNVFEVITDRTDGKPTARQELTGADGGPMEIKQLDREATLRRIDELIAKRNGTRS